MVTLRNPQSRKLVFELPHQFICSEEECLCTISEQRGRTHDPVTGEIGVRSEEVRYPLAIVIHPRTTSQALPDGTLEVPAVAEAIRRGQIIAD